jgi:hypothetical protein
MALYFSGGANQYLIGCLLRIATAAPQQLRRLMAVDDQTVGKS